MSITKDVFLSILALDSYNRGYGPGIELEDDNGTQIGAATISKTTIDIPGFQSKAEDAGFYAVAYKLNDTVGTGGDTLAKDTIVISYRGTDEAKDVWNGWTTIGGFPGQSDLAAKFYQAVKAPNPDKTIGLTGHSPGGALASLNPAAAH